MHAMLCTSKSTWESTRPQTVSHHNPRCASLSPPVRIVLQLASCSPPTPYSLPPPGVCHRDPLLALPSRLVQLSRVPNDANATIISHSLYCTRSLRAHRLPRRSYKFAHRHRHSTAPTLALTCRAPRLSILHRQLRGPITTLSRPPRRVRAHVSHRTSRIATPSTATLSRPRVEAASRARPRALFGSIHCRYTCIHAAFSSSPVLPLTAHAAGRSLTIASDQDGTQAALSSQSPAAPHHSPTSPPHLFR